MNCAILIYHGKHGDQYWLADTPQRREAAKRALFNQLDEWGCYQCCDNADVESWLPKAREGNARAIHNILGVREQYEYESWEIEYAQVSEEPASPNGAEPGSLTYAAEQWMREQGFPPPVESKHPHLYQAMLEEYLESHARELDP